MKYAPKRDDGLYAYVRTSRSWGRESSHIVWAASSADAKRDFGWTRELHTSISIRRATPEDAANLRDYR